jgi:hypothetical protein
MLRFVRDGSMKAGGAARRWWGGMVLLMGLSVLLAACGSAGGGTASYSYQSSGSSHGDAGVAAPAATSGKGAAGGSTGQPTLPNGTPANTYLIRSLDISLQVNKPLDAEQQISKDLLAMDPAAQAAGDKISQDGDGSYVVSLTFSITSPHYAAVKDYLHQFAQMYPGFKGKLVSEDESVQNVTAQYVDLQSRLTNLRTEQQRLLQLLSQAQNLSDTLTIQDKLTDVEGQIEQIEGQINQLAGQTSYSTVTINLSAPSSAPAIQPAEQSSWSIGQVLGGAASALVVVLQIVFTVLIWVLVFVPLWGPPLAFYLWRRAKLERTRRAARLGVGAASASGSGIGIQ